MEKIENIIFFENISKEDYSKAINCLNGEIIEYKKKEYISISKNILKASIILEGIVDLISIDEDGKIIIHDRFFTDQAFIFDNNDENKEFFAVTDVKILVLDLDTVFKEEKNNCSIRKLIMENIIKQQNAQNQELNYKVDIYLEKSLRKKIIKYLQKIKPMYKSDTIIIPFNRYDLASYLSCDRSALSRELSRMEKEELIKVDKNTIKLLKLKLD